MEKRTGISLHGNVDISYVKSFELHDMAVQHYHEGFEIYFQVDGNRFFFLKDKQYLLKRGDIVVLLPYELHYGAVRSRRTMSGIRLILRKPILKQFWAMRESVCF